MSTTLLMHLTEGKNIFISRTVLRECRARGITYNTKVLNGGNFIKISCKCSSQETEFTRIIKDVMNPFRSLLGGISSCI